MALAMLDVVPPSRSPADGEVVSGYTLLRELGARVPATYLASGPGPGPLGVKDFVVVERLERRGAVTAEDAATFVRDAKRLVQLRHPNVVGGKNVVVTAEDVLVVSDLVEGATYADLAQAARERGEPIPLTITLRILIDILQGLSALHDRRDPGGAVAAMVHGCVAPMNAVVGIDGTARLIGVSRAPASAGPPAAEAIGYLAPEMLLGDASADARADVFGVGVILWEALTGARMHTDLNAGTIVLRLLGGKVEPPPTPEGAPWAEPLIATTMRAIAPDPTARFPTAAAFTGELRRAVGAKLASKAAVAQIVDAWCGPRIRARRAALLPVPRAATAFASTPRRADIPTPIVAMTIPTDDAVEIIDVDLAPDPSDAKIAAPAPSAPRAGSDPGRTTVVPGHPPPSPPVSKPAIARTPGPSLPYVAPTPSPLVPETAPRAAMATMPLGQAFAPIVATPPPAPTPALTPSPTPAPSPAPPPSPPPPRDHAPARWTETSSPSVNAMLASSPSAFAAAPPEPHDTPPPAAPAMRRRAVAIGIAMLLIAVIAFSAIRFATRETQPRGPIAPAPHPTETAQARSAIAQEAIPPAPPEAEPRAEGADVASSPAPESSSTPPVGERPPAPATTPEPAGTKPKKSRYDPMGI